MKYEVTIISMPSLFSKPYRTYNFDVVRIEYKSRRKARRKMMRLLRLHGTPHGYSRNVKFLFRSEGEE